VPVHPSRAARAASTSRPGPRDRQLLDQPVPFGGHLVGREGRLGQDGAEEVEHLAEVGGEDVAAEDEPVGVDAGVQVAAQALDRRGESGAVVPGRAGQQRLGQQHRLGRVVLAGR